MSTFSTKVLNWYHKHGRILPWRGEKDPYKVLVSEIMLQQTRVDTVIPYYEKWMKRFPSLEALAGSSEQEVLATWEGLGYYSRARNLYRAARMIMDEYGGEFPNDVDMLQRLPGIGKYTARAVASMAFGADTATLDANIRRVLARYFNVSIPADSNDWKKELWSLAEKNLPHGKAGDYNQALMDLGATVCTPTKPVCDTCPLRRSCLAYNLGIQQERPLLKPKAKVPHYTVTAAVIRKNGEVLLAQRPISGLLGGMWEFPGGKQEPGESLEDCLQRELMEELGIGIEVGDPLGIFKHGYTHFRITLHAFMCKIVSGDPKPIQAEKIAWLRINQMDDYPMGKVDRMIARSLDGG